jgi:hypothetical protein
MANAPLNARNPKEKLDHTNTVPQSRLSATHLDNLSHSTILGSLKLDHVIGQDNGNNGEKFLV